MIVLDRAARERSQITRRASGIDRDPRTRPPPTCATGSRARASSLPDEVDEPVIAKVEADAQPDHLSGALVGPARRRSRSPTTPTASSRTGCRTCPAWPRCRIFGARTLRHADLARPAAAGRLRPDAAGRRGRRCGGRTSRCRPAGSRASEREFTVLAETDLRTAEQFDDLIIRDADGYLVRLKDVGEAEIGARGRAHASPASWATRRWRWASSSSRRPTRSTSREAVKRSPAADQPRSLPDGHEARCRLRQLDLHRQARSTTCSTPSSKRSCWSCS